MKKLYSFIFVFFIMLLTSFVANATNEAVLQTGTCGENTYWKLNENGTLRIYGEGDISGIGSWDSAPWDIYREIITSVIIENGVTSIDSFSFADCSNLETVFMPISIKTIEWHSFANCDSLLDVFYNGTYDDWKEISIGSTAYIDMAQMHYSDDYIKHSDAENFVFNNGVIAKYNGTEKIVYIPPAINGIDVKTIADSAFANIETTYQVVIPNTVMNIEDNAFKNCDTLRRVVIPENVKSIGNNTFQYCYKLIEAKIPEGITEIPDYMFNRCQNLKRVELPSTIKSIGREAMNYCSALTDINIPYGIETISVGAFQSCTSLTKIVLPNTVNKICERAFYGCSNISEIIFSENITEIQADAFYDCSSLKNVILPNITTISTQAFYRCYSLSDITINKSVKTVDVDAFYGCYSLNNVYYVGTEKEWENIRFDDGNEYLTNANLNYECEYKNYYTIYYYLNGGNNTILPNVVEKGTHATITELIPQKTNYQFLGWATSKAATVPEYLSGEVYTAGKSITLYAVWRIVPKTSTTVTKQSGYYIGEIETSSLPNSCNIIISKYKNNRYVSLESRPYQNQNEIFAIFEDIDTVKIMVWEITNTLRPITEVEVINIE